MEYKETLTVSKQTAEKIKKAIDWKIGCDPKDRMDEDEYITLTVDFENGYQADLMCCGCQYEDENDGIDLEIFPRHNAASTEMILFGKDGEEELTSSEPESKFFGMWELNYGNDSYKINVVEEN